MKPEVPMPMRHSRREFLTVATAGSALAATSGCAHAAPATVTSAVTKGNAPTAKSAIPRRPLGKTGASVSVLGVGGSHLGDVPDEKDAHRIVAEAIDAG